MSRPAGTSQARGPPRWQKQWLQAVLPLSRWPAPHAASKSGSRPPDELIYLVLQLFELLRCLLGCLLCSLVCSQSGLHRQAPPQQHIRTCFTPSFLKPFYPGDTAERLPSKRRGLLLRPEAPMAMSSKVTGSTGQVVHMQNCVCPPCRPRATCVWPFGGLEGQAHCCRHFHT